MRVKFLYVYYTLQLHRWSIVMSFFVSYPITFSGVLCNKSNEAQHSSQTVCTSLLRNPKNVHRVPFILTNLPDKRNNIQSAVRKVMVKQSHYRPWQALRIPEGWNSQILRQSAHEGGKVVSPTHRPPLPHQIFLGLIYVGGWVDTRAMVRPEGLCRWKIAVTQSRIEPATFGLVA
jgi:hypothetical protein